MNANSNEQLSKQALQAALDGPFTELDRENVERCLLFLDRLALDEPNRRADVAAALLWVGRHGTERTDSAVVDFFVHAQSGPRFLAQAEVLLAERPELASTSLQLWDETVAPEPLRAQIPRLREAFSALTARTGAVVLEAPETTFFPVRFRDDLLTAAQWHLDWASPAASWEWLANAARSRPWIAAELAWVFAELRVAVPGALAAFDVDLDRPPYANVDVQARDLGGLPLVGATARTAGEIEAFVHQCAASSRSSAAKAPLGWVARVLGARPRWRQRVDDALAASLASADSKATVAALLNDPETPLQHVPKTVTALADGRVSMRASIANANWAKWPLCTGADPRLQSAEALGRALHAQLAAGVTTGSETAGQSTFSWLHAALANAAGATGDDVRLAVADSAGNALRNERTASSALLLGTQMRDKRPLNEPLKALLDHRPPWLQASIQVGSSPWSSLDLAAELYDLAKLQVAQSPVE